MKRMAVLTSGGDAPGMNATIRSVVRVGIDKTWQVMGIRHGYTGLLTNNVVPLGARDVSGIIQQGGTMLGSARCPEFKTEDGRLQALRVLAEHKIEVMVIIGGGGSQLHPWHPAVHSALFCGEDTIFECLSTKPKRDCAYEREPVYS